MQVSMLQVQTLYNAVVFHLPGSGVDAVSGGCTKQWGLYTITDPSQEQSAILLHRAGFTVGCTCKADDSIYTHHTDKRMQSSITNYELAIGWVSEDSQ